MSPATPWRPERRDFLKASTAALFGLMAGGCASGVKPLRSPLRFGLITDMHYADVPTRGRRFYRESLPKVRKGVTRLCEARVAFLAALGDLKDTEVGESEDRTLSHLDEQEFLA